MRKLELVCSNECSTFANNKRCSHNKVVFENNLRDWAREKAEQLPPSELKEELTELGKKE